MAGGAAQVFLDLDWTLMEMNPFTLDAAGFPFPLDMRGELDDTAAFKSGKKCARARLPVPEQASLTCAVHARCRHALNRTIWGKPTGLPVASHICGGNSTGHDMTLLLTFECP